VALERNATPPAPGLPIAVVQLPTIANFDDFDPLAAEPGVALRYVERPEQLEGAAAVILPGVKHTLAARRWLRERGFDQVLQSFPGAVVGICGGYQLLGERISDPQGVEGYGGDEPGLGLLPIETIFSAEKRTVQVEATALTPWAQDAPVAGYEIHMGRSRPLGEPRPTVQITRRGAAPVGEPDGYQGADGRVWGCYIHGIFAGETFRRAWLRSLGWQETVPLVAGDPYDRLADQVQAALDGRQLDRFFTL
jgi:adenosylcobyric acid synthase